MQLTRNLFTIADLNEWLARKDLIVNRDYQRGRGLWPINARSFLIDTILCGFPFPKITIRQNVDLKTKKSFREIIDGQQRMLTIRDFVLNKFKLSNVSEKYSGLYFSDLDEDTQTLFFSYEVSVDTIISASEDDVLEVFRRMNSYTLPLNKAEQRHATYQGYFKWYIIDLIKLYTPFIEAYGILSNKQISRMGDADLFTELCELVLTGMHSRTSKRLNDLYKSYENDFPVKNILEDRLIQVLDTIKTEFIELLDAKVLSGYSLYSLAAALIYNKWGIENINETEDILPPANTFFTNVDSANRILLEMFYALDCKDESGEYGEFVKACIKTTHSIGNRQTRLKWMVKALQSE